MSKIILVLLTSSLFYQVSANNCEFKGAGDFYQRLTTQSLSAQKYKEISTYAESLEELAAQRPNPNVDIEYLRGHTKGSDTDNYRASIRHVVELGSKRMIRKSAAKVQADFEKREAFAQMQELFTKQVINYQRIGQLGLMISGVKEAKESFSKILKSLKGRKSLTPEERVSVATLDLAVNDYSAKLNVIQNERNFIKANLLSEFTCLGLSVEYKELSYRGLRIKSEIDEAKGLIGLESLKVELAQADVKIQKSLKTTNLEIGPSLEYQNQPQNKNLGIGLSASFTLPLFGRNPGGELRAYQKERLERVSTSLNIRRFKSLRESAVFSFKNSVEALKGMTSLSELEVKHARVEKLFERGVISIPMTIESHRQYLDFLESKFSTENNLIEAVSQISMIDGDQELFKEILK